MVKTQHVSVINCNFSKAALRRMKSVGTRGGSRTCYISHICKSLFCMLWLLLQLNSTVLSAAVSLCVGGNVKYCPWMLSGIWQPLDETLLICVFVCNDSCSQRLRQKTQLAENEQRRPWIFGESCWAAGFRGGFWSIWQDSAQHLTNSLNQLHYNILASIMWKSNGKCSRNKKCVIFPILLMEAW